MSGNRVGPYAPFDEPGAVLGGFGLLRASGAAQLGRRGAEARGVELDLGVRYVLDRAHPEVVAGHLVAPGQPRSVYATLRWGV